jgi:microcystin-dependent protein
VSDPYIGEIRLVGFNFPPVGWAFCNGQLLAISQNTALFQLIGTTYGGDGVNSFGLPDLQGRAMVGTGTGATGSAYNPGQLGGVENVQLNTAQIPAHGLPIAATKTGTRPAPNSGLAPGGSYAPAAAANVQMEPVGSGQPHDNMAPFLAMNFIISLFGIFPSQT